MPFASKVGAMPHEQQSSRYNSGRDNRSSLQKAITIQDLKKQTAMRLAQEHHQSQGMPGDAYSASVAADPRTNRPVVSLETLAARRNANASVGFESAQHPQVHQREAAPLHYQRLHHQGPVLNHIPNNAEASGMAPSPQYFDKPRNKNRQQVRKTKWVPGSSPQHSVPHGAMKAGAGSRFHKDQRSQFLMASPPPNLPSNRLSSSGSLPYNTASSNQGRESSSCSKLPHGLTVHELKEMTKARLQAEAGDQVPSSGDRNASENGADNMEAQDTGAFDSVHSNPPQSMPAHMQHMHTQNMLPEPTPYFQQRAHASPPAPAFQIYNHSNASSYDNANQEPDRSLGNRNRVDSFPDSNWENASVTSHNSTVASDYLGSESAFSSGVGGAFSQGGDDQTGSSLGRTLSFPVPSRDGTPTSVPSPLSSSYYDASASMAENRQRAMTLSPRPGLSLLHEDRPGFSDDALGIPSFSSSSRHPRQQLPTRSRRSFSPIMQQPQGFIDENLVGFGSNAPGIFGDVMYENRARTSSAVSLPAISHTSDEFALDGNGGNSRRSSDVVNMGGAVLQEHATLSLTGAGETMMSSSSLYSSSAMRSTSSVFRDDYGSISAPPGLGGPNESLSSSSLLNPLATRAASMDGIGMVSDNNRVRASTWVAGGDVFGASSGLYRSSADDYLAGDLASILKLSGAEEKDDGFPGGGNIY